MKHFEAIIGYEDIKIELERVLDTIINNEKYEALGVKVPAGILLHGAPGVGKTLFATTFLKNSGRPYFVCRKDRPDGEFVNEIKNVFEKAKEAAPSIVLLDDIDKFANATRRYSNDEEFVTVQSCIDEIKHEGKAVFVFATANEIDKLPESLTRSGRFDKIIEMDVPMTADAAKIISIIFQINRWKKIWISRSWRGFLKGIPAQILKLLLMRPAFIRASKVGI
jgi:cell division protease FtsH